MAAPQQKWMTAPEFDTYASRPENTSRILELLDGEVIEKVPSNPRASEIAQLVAFYIRLYLREHQIAGHVTGEQGGFMVDGERYAPDAAYISTGRQPELVEEGYNPMPPELAVEVELPSTAASERRLRVKLYHYLVVGTLVWVIYPETQEVEVHQVGAAPRTLRLEDALTGGDVLPGFTLTVKDIFAV
jgi:Uma2 family endonuclease